MQVKNAFLPQYLGQYSGPWHLAQAIAGSQYVTTDIDAADIVYVYDYCYYTWWLAFVHSNGRVQREDATPGDHLLKGYQVRSMYVPLNLAGDFCPVRLGETSGALICIISKDHLTCNEHSVQMQL